MLIGLCHAQFKPQLYNNDIIICSLFKTILQIPPIRIEKLGEKRSTSCEQIFNFSHHLERVILKA